MRVVGWTQKLAEVIEAARSKPFEWGIHDCGVFAADVVLAITGEDPAVALRGYTSNAEAEAHIASYGSVHTMATRLLGKEPVHPSRAHRGDVVMIQLGGRDSLGVCTGTHVVIPFTDHVGLIVLTRTAAVLAWRIE